MAITCVCNICSKEGYADRNNHNALHEWKFIILNLKGGAEEIIDAQLSSEIDEEKIFELDGCFVRCPECNTKIEQGIGAGAT